jgi:hypothetical protein
MALLGLPRWECLPADFICMRQENWLVVDPSAAPAVGMQPVPFVALGARGGTSTCISRATRTHFDFTDGSIADNS